MLSRLTNMAKRYRDGRHYRSRAKECRRLAEQMPASEARQKMLYVAADYERMAENLDRDVGEVDKRTPNPEAPPSRDDPKPR